METECGALELCWRRHVAVTRPSFTSLRPLTQASRGPPKTMLTAVRRDRRPVLLRKRTLFAHLSGDGLSLNSMSADREFVEAVAWPAGFAVFACSAVVLYARHRQRTASLSRCRNLPLAWFADRQMTSTWGKHQADDRPRSVGLGPRRARFWAAARVGWIAVLPQGSSRRPLAQARPAHRPPDD
jgi:hypothetical protein